MVNGSCTKVDDDTLQCCTEVSKEQTPDGFTTVNVCKNYKFSGKLPDTADDCAWDPGCAKNSTSTGGGGDGK